MAKIKITEKSKEIEGSLKKGNVKPFGTSAHIPFSKNHLGKIVNVIIPFSPKYVWIFDEKLREKLIKSAKEVALKTSKKDTHYFLSCIEDFSNDEFSFNSLMKIILLLENDDNLKKDLVKIKSSYNIL
jgi:putative transposon-encoded protein